MSDSSEILGRIREVWREVGIRFGYIWVKMIEWGRNERV